MVKIFGIQPTSLQDFPGKIAAIVFLAGCNFRCVYCHNLSAVDGGEQVSEEDFFSFLEARKGKLQGIVVSGGEPTLQQDLPQFLSNIKQKGFLVKLDSNGSNPKMLETVLKQKLVDFVALDVKAPQSKHDAITQSKGQFVNVQKSIRLLKESGILHEFRTTCHPSLSRDDILACAQQVKGAQSYFLQQYNEVGAQNPSLRNYSLEDLEALSRDCKPLFGEVGIR